MRALLLSVLMLASVTAQAQSAQGQGRGRRANSVVVANGPITVIDRAALDTKLDRIERLLDESLRRLGNGRDARTVRDAADEVEELRVLLGLRDFDDDLPPPPPVPPAPPPPPARRTIDATTLGTLLDSISREPRPDDQVRLVEQAGPVNYFIVDQVRMVLERVRGDAQRLRAATAFRGRIVDPENNFVLASLFTASADKQALTRILAGDDAATGGLRAVSDADLRNLVNEVGARLSGSQRYDVLAIRAPELWFTTRQARQLLDLFLGSTDKMRALRLLRPRLLDPQNVDPIVDAFLGNRDREDARKLLLGR